MFKKFSCFVVAMALACIASSCFAGAAPTTVEVEQKFKKILRNTKVESISESPIRGLYEVVAGPNVFYFSPEGAGYLVFGNIVDNEGKNVTAENLSAIRAKFMEKRKKVVAEKLKGAPLDKAVKIGNGKNVVIEFTDPDCPYCRKVDSYLSARRDVTRYVFLNALPYHKDAKAKSVYILNSKNKAKAMHEVFTGKHDAVLPISNADLSKYPEALSKLEAGMKYGREVGVQGTPLLFINGEEVNGADFKKIGELLKK